MWKFKYCHKYLSLSMCHNQFDFLIKSMICTHALSSVKKLPRDYKFHHVLGKIIKVKLPGNYSHLNHYLYGAVIVPF